MNLYLPIMYLHFPALGRSWRCVYKYCHSTVVLYLCVAEAKDGRCKVSSVSVSRANRMVLVSKCQSVTCNRFVVSNCSCQIIPRHFVWGWDLRQWPDFPSFGGGRLPIYNNIFCESHVAWGALGYEPNLRSHCSAAQLVKTSWARLAIIKQYITYRFLHQVYAVLVWGIQNV